MAESVLNAVKSLVNLTADNTDFDQELIIHINAGFSRLHQLGVGPSPQFKITGASETWEQFIGDTENIESVRAYMGLRARLVVDAATMTSYAINALKEVINEYEFNLRVSQEEVRHPWHPPLTSILP